MNKLISLSNTYDFIVLKFDSTQKLNWFRTFSYIYCSTIAIPTFSILQVFNNITFMFKF